ncbi:DMT family transporter [Lactiplantibacillus garii]|uniref:DMT family transporter n=1 Tax=Lactiplantibacillus garii TaxID=2306423 RepID=A0A426D3L6_9LACO|nr:DMT family transporter [Lactiplantibacillus garii]RRK09265.1 DMT family transporter [Lactiplantibacillus garii]
MNSKKLLGAGLLSGAACIWGGMFVVVKLVVGTIPPIELVWLRYLIALITLIGWACFTHVKWYFRRNDLGLILLIGLIGNTISIVTQETGTWLSNAQTGAVITSATPTFMLLFATWLLHEHLTKIKLVSVSLATLGVLIIVGLHFTGHHTLLGILALTVAALTWALMSVLIKRLSDRYTAVQVTIMSTSVAIVLLTPIVISQFQTLNHVNFGQPSIFSALGYLGVVSTAGAFVMWNRGLQLLPASSSGLFFLLQPIVGTLLGWLLLGESVSWHFLLGSGLIVLSVWIAIKFND